MSMDLNTKNRLDTIRIRVKEKKLGADLAFLDTLARPVKPVYADSKLLNILVIHGATTYRAVVQAHI